MATFLHCYVRYVSTGRAMSRYRRRRKARACRFSLVLQILFWRICRQWKPVLQKTERLQQVSHPVSRPCLIQSNGRLYERRCAQDGWPRLMGLSVQSFGYVRNRRTVVPTTFGILEGLPWICRPDITEIMHVGCYNWQRCHQLYVLRTDGQYHQTLGHNCNPDMACLVVGTTGV